MKKKIVVFLLFTFTCIAQFMGQEKKSTLELLMSKEWKWQSTVKGVDIYMNFTREKYTDTTCFKQEKVVMDCTFYLSDDIDTTFDKQKVGKTNTGKFLVYFSEKSNKITVLEILELDENKLIIKAKNNTILIYTATK